MLLVAREQWNIKIILHVTKRCVRVAKCKQERHEITSFFYPFGQRIFDASSFRLQGNKRVVKRENPLKGYFSNNIIISFVYSPLRPPDRFARGVHSVVVATSESSHMHKPRPPGASSRPRLPHTSTYSIQWQNKAPLNHPLRTKARIS